MILKKNINAPLVLNIVHFNTYRNEGNIMPHYLNKKKTLIQFFLFYYITQTMAIVTNIPVFLEICFHSSQ